MTKNLLFSVALSTIAFTSNAQNLVANKASIRPIQKSALEAPKSVENLQFVKKSPAKSPDTGVGFSRPDGVYYSEYTFGESMAALFAPSIETLKFEHYCQYTPTWYINGNEQSGNYVDEEGNFEIAYPVVLPSNEYGYNAYYSPTLKSQGEEFTLTDIIMCGGADFFPITNSNPAKIQNYTGFQQGPAWGTNSYMESIISTQVEGAQPFGIFQSFEKPITPMYVKSLTTMFWTESANPLAGKQLTAKVFKLNESGEIDLENPDYTLICKEAEILGEFSAGSYGQVQFYNLVQDPLLGEIDEPFVMDSRYGVLIEGYNQDGVDVRFMLGDQGEDPNELYTALPTRVATVVPAEDGNGTEVAYYYWASTEKGYCYIMPMGFNVLYDVVKVYEETSTVHISNDGQTTWTEGATIDSDDDYKAVYMQTSFPWSEGGEPNYEIEGCPDWLHLQVVEDFYETENSEGINVVAATADALPAGETSRVATVTITSFKGAKSNVPMTFVQGETPAGINSLSVSTLKNATLYNIAGQQVDNNYKGIVISNGKKYLNK